MRMNNADYGMRWKWTNTMMGGSQSWIDYGYGLKIDTGPCMDMS